MRGYLRRIGNSFITEPNSEYRYEIDRYFRRMVTAFAPGNQEMGGDLFFAGNHTLDDRRHLFPYLDYHTVLTGVATTTNEVFNFRRRASHSIDPTPVEPGQIAWAMGRIMMQYSSTNHGNPVAVMTSVDVNRKKIGSVFGHPINNRAYFTDTTNTATGVGNVLNGGPLVFANGEEGHYMYSIRISQTGDDAGADYWWTRRPYFLGTYEPGDAGRDQFDATGEILSNRFTTSATSRGCLDIQHLIPDNAAPSPAAVPYDLRFPSDTQTGLSFVSAQAFDGVSDGGRCWFACIDDAIAGATGNRGLWAWKRMTGEALNRYDADANAGAARTMVGWPVIPGSAQYRDIKAARGGYMFLAADGEDDASTGTAEAGALIQFDAGPITGVGNSLGTPSGAGIQTFDDAEASFPSNVVGLRVRISGGLAGNNGDFVITARNSSTQLEIDNPGGQSETSSFVWEILDSVVGVIDVFGTSVASIYTVGGMLSQDILAVTVDSTESRTGSGTNDNFAVVSTTVTLTDAGAHFTSALIGLSITIAGATSGDNDGTFTIIGVPSATTIEYTNATPGIAEAGAGTWAIAGADRVWCMHRNGLSFFDLNTVDGTTSPPETVAAAAADFNPLEADSIRGLAGFDPVGSSATPNQHGAMLDHDTDGDIYWVTTQTGGTHTTGGPNRLNRLIADPTSFAHTFYSIDAAEEAGPPTGSQGFFKMGANSASIHSIIKLKVHRRMHDAASSPTTGDPEDDDIWVSTGSGDNTGGAVSAASRNVGQIPIGDWGGGDNPGIGYFGDTMSSTTTDIAWHMQVTPDGSAWVTATNNSFIGLLDTLGRFVTDQSVSNNKNLSVPAGTIQTLTDSTASFTDKLLGKRIVLTNTSVGTNTGSFKVVAFNSSTSIDIDNPNAASAEVSIDFDWIFQGVDFDSRSTDGGAVGSWTDATSPNMGPNDWYPPVPGVAGGGSGLGIAHRGASGAAKQMILVHTVPIANQWDSGSSSWFRSRVHHNLQPVTDGTDKPAHTTQDALDSGVTTAFADTGAGGDEFVEDENYTFTASIGIIKGGTETIDFGYDIFHEKTDLTNRLEEADKTAIEGVARGGFINIGAIGASDDPFLDGDASDLSTDRQAQQLAHYQRRIPLNGSNNTETITISGTINTTDGPQIGLDLGSDNVASIVRFGLTDIIDFVAGDLTIELYSATAADLGGSPPNETIAWGSPRLTYTSETDNPDWVVTPGTFRLPDIAPAFQTNNVGVDIEIDLVAAAAGARLANPGTNDTMRFWKIVILRTTGSSSWTVAQVVGAVAFDTASPALPIGIADDKFITEANDTNYLATNFIRVTVPQDSAATDATRVDSTTVTFGSPIELFKSVTGSGVISGTQPSMTLVDASATGDNAFTASDVGKYILLQNMTTGDNDGLFLITAFTSGTEIDYTNALGIAESFPGGGLWTIDGVAANDFFRELDAAPATGQIIQEAQIDTVDSPTQVTLKSGFPLDPFTATPASWQVVRNAVLRPRDDEGGGEDQAQFPPVGVAGQGEIYFDPITGWIAYNDFDIIASKVFAFERYVKVKRSL